MMMEGADSSGRPGPPALLPHRGDDVRNLPFRTNWHLRFTASFT